MPHSPFRHFRHFTFLAAAVLGLVALGPWTAPASADSTLASVTAGGVTANVSFSSGTTTCSACVSIYVTMLTNGPGTLQLQASSPNGQAPVTATLVATGAGSVSTPMQVCPQANGTGTFTVTGTFTANGASVPIPAGVSFQVTPQTPTFRTFTAQVKGSKTAITGQVLVVTTEGMVGATGSVRLTVQPAGGKGRWTTLGTATLSSGYGQFSAQYPSSKAPRGSTVRATLINDPYCTTVTSTTKVT